MSGWGDRTFQEMLFSITDIAKKLRLKNEDILLNIGCGAGIFEIAFSHWVSKIYSIDYSENMVKIAKQHTSSYKNISIIQGNICDIPFPDNFFDKILVHAMIQYLNDMEEVDIALRELKRVSKPGSIISISLLPNKDTKPEYINGFYQLGLSDEEITKKIEINNLTLWFDKDDLNRRVEKAGLMVIETGLPVSSFQSKYFFDLVITNKKSI